MRKKTDVELETILSQMESSFLTTFGKELSKEDYDRVLLAYHKELVDKFILSRINGLDPQSIDFLLKKGLTALKQPEIKVEVDKKVIEASKAVDQNFRVILKNEKAKGVKKGKN